MTATYRLFATRVAADRYAFACHLRILRRRAHEGDGTLLNIATRAKERVVDEWPDDHDTIRTWLATLTAAQLRALNDRVARLPLLGRRNDGRINEADGYTTAWDVPRATKDGRWAVQCPPFDTGGVAAPEWPDPPPTI